MTIAITLKVTDGIVIASDSATTIGRGDAGNVYNHAEKLFNLMKGKPIAAVMWGLGNIGDASMAMVIRDLRKEFGTGEKRWRIDPTKFTVEEIATKLKSYIYDHRYKPWCEKSEGLPKVEWPSFGMMISGYSSNEATPEVWRLTVERGEAEVSVDSPRTSSIGFTWGGDYEAIHRLIIGYDMRLPYWVARELAEDERKAAADAVEGPVAALDEAEVDKLAARLRPAFSKAGATIEPRVLPAWMPIQDTIDLAQFLVDLSAKYSRYTPSYQTIGGPTDIATITKYEGFKWVKRKHYYDAALNPKP